MTSNILDDFFLAKVPGDSPNKIWLNECRCSIDTHLYFIFPVGLVYVVMPISCFQTFIVEYFYLFLHLFIVWPLSPESLSANVYVRLCSSHVCSADCSKDH